MYLPNTGNNRNADAQWAAKMQGSQCTAPVEVFSNVPYNGGKTEQRGCLGYLATNNINYTYRDAKWSFKWKARTIRLMANAGNDGG